MTIRVPGPRPTLFGRLIYRPGRDPLAFFSNLARTYGDIVQVSLVGERLFLVSNPSSIKDILVTNNSQFIKGRGLERAKRLLGDGLLTSEGAVHLRQRRLMQPAFHRDRISAYGATMVEHATAASRSWQDGAAIDAAQAMNRLTLSIAAKTLFDTRLDLQAAEIGEALTGVIESFWMMMLPFSHVIERLPIPSILRSRRSRERLDAIIYSIIAERRASGRDHADLLSMLLHAQDSETQGGMSDRQVRDEAMTILLAGHETTANALTWTWYLLSQAPDAEKRLHDEIDRELEGRPPTVADIPRLRVAEQIVTESMRLYPPAWIIGRRALVDYSIGDFVIPARSIVVMSPWILHRDSRTFSEPIRFAPERWTPEFKASLPSCAYLPFGAGPRRCIGESFAWMELVLILTTIAQHWMLRLVPGHPVDTQPLVTLRAKHGMKMSLARRAPR